MRFDDKDIGERDACAFFWSYATPLPPLPFALETRCGTALPSSPHWGFLLPHTPHLAASHLTPLLHPA
jgi:hypothetical protein